MSTAWDTILAPSATVSKALDSDEHAASLSIVTNQVRNLSRIV